MYMYYCIFAYRFWNLPVIEEKWVRLVKEAGPNGRWLRPKEEERKEGKNNLLYVVLKYLSWSLVAPRQFRALTLYLVSRVLLNLCLAYWVNY